MVQCFAIQEQRSVHYLLTVPVCMGGCYAASYYTAQHGIFEVEYRKNGTS